MRRFTLVPLVLLAACSAPGGTPAPETVRETVREATQPPTTLGIIEGKEQTEPALETLPPTTPPLSPEDLITLSPREVQAMLGAPTLVRRDANVQIMLFEDSDCVFEVIFYEPDPDAHYAATTTNARTKSGVDIDQTECLAKVLPEGQWLTAK